ncbi:hypothetical protein [Streptomyces sp. NBC_01244]|uniref:hypothetical protein n=1 Tax=Streptomyces sp. NBC_01244 TaxID=2903797 RepID=UPI002E13631A|nr:hypothetical protein OG247_23500 [Streptomyces sp. NBC_01244]
MSTRDVAHAEGAPDVADDPTKLISTHGFWRLLPEGNELAHEARREPEPDLTGWLIT